MAALIDAAIALGFPLRKQGKSWGGPSCPVCGKGETGSNRLSVFLARDGRERWRCFACGTGGDLADFLACAKGIPLREALKQANEPSSRRGDASPPQYSEDLVREVAAALPTWDDQVAGYLKQRGISTETILSAVKRGMLRMLPADPYEARKILLRRVGEGKLRQAGLLKSNWPAAAFRPLCFLMPGGSAIEFRLIKMQADPDSPKAIRYGKMVWPWFWKPEPSGRRISRITIVEGAIDLLSYVEIGLSADEMVMAIPGVQAWKHAWLEAIARKYPDARVAVGLDDDDAGSLAAQEIGRFCQRLGIESTRLVPPAKDWNETLKGGIHVRH